MKAVLALLAVSAALFIYRQISGLRRNIALAKASGLPYAVARTCFPSSRRLAIPPPTLSLHLLLAIAPD
jgi:hypothetical protein